MQPHGSSLQENLRPNPANAAPKKKRNPPGNPSPDAEVVALSPRTLLATNRVVCDICHKGFQREQNLQLHLRGHNMPWKLKPKNPGEARRRVYVCPELSCVHHNPSRALGDLTGIKKHYCRKHGEKRLTCANCNKRYAVESDWKAHIKTCGSREYRCDCGQLFCRKDAYRSHCLYCHAVAAAAGVTGEPVPSAIVDNLCSGNPGGGAVQGQAGAAAAEPAPPPPFEYDPLGQSQSQPAPPLSSMFRAQAPGSTLPSFFPSGGAPPAYPPQGGYYYEYEDGGQPSHGAAQGYYYYENDGQSSRAAAQGQYYENGGQFSQGAGQGYTVESGGQFSHGAGQGYTVESGGQFSHGAGQGYNVENGSQFFHGAGQGYTVESGGEFSHGASQGYNNVEGGGQSSRAAAQRPRRHGKQPVVDDMMQVQLPAQYQQPGGGDGNPLHLGFFSGGGGSGSGVARRRGAGIAIREPFSGGAVRGRGPGIVVPEPYNGGGGSNNAGAEYGPLIKSLENHFGTSFPYLYDSLYPAGQAAGSQPPQNSATEILMKAAGLGPTESTDHGPTRLLFQAGYVPDNGQGARAAGEGSSSAAAAANETPYFCHDFPNVLSDGGDNNGGFFGGDGASAFGGFFDGDASAFGSFPGASAFDGGVGDGEPSTIDFLGVGGGDGDGDAMTRTGAPHRLSVQRAPSPDA
ncbi:hypothetical protein ACP4OV_023842 [Aristida adscensionis]